MLKRTHKRVIPDRACYLRVELPERGTHVFRIPSLAIAVPLVELVAEASQSELPEGRRNARLTEVAGAVLGATWAHEWLDLDAPPYRDAPDLYEYGSLVVEDLDAAGYTTDEVISMFTEVTNALAALMPRDTEVKERANF